MATIETGLHIKAEEIPMHKDVKEIMLKILEQNSRILEQNSEILKFLSHPMVVLNNIPENELLSMIK